ncbi:MAG TPA: esterase-like activity of phytase family protein [Mycobacteriales bacterium]|nr:esterase-like activity of phytase family protein [Mycobacteriales bacterium]
MRLRRLALVSGALTALAGISVLPAGATNPPAAATTSAPGVCPPGALELGYSDALDKKVVDGTTVGGLSSIDYDARRHAYATVVDNDESRPSRLWFIRDLGDPQVTGTLILRRPGGTPYNGTDADNEGLTVLPDGRYLVSSETEPSIRIFGRDGVQQGSLPVPARFRVAPAGEATENATLEGLSASPSGRYVYAAMEGTLSGDAPESGAEAVWRRILVFHREHGQYGLQKQIGYRVDPGMRISEISAYDDGRFAVLEAFFSTDFGNRTRVYAVTDANSAPDVSGIANLSEAPRRDIMRKSLVVDFTRCPSMGAPAKEHQTNPLMDNYEAMTIRADRIGPFRYGTLAVLSDDNFGSGQTTRIVRVATLLP